MKARRAGQGLCQIEKRHPDFIPIKQRRHKLAPVGDPLPKVAGDDRNRIRAQL
jgi:hypothetical protein